MRTELRTPLRVLLTAAVAGSAAVAIAFGPQVGADDALPGTTTTTTTVATSTTLAPTTTTLAPTTSAAPSTTTPAPPTTVAATDVTALQQRLTDLGFWLGEVDGTSDKLTQQAVLAFQKANGLGRDGTAGPATLAALATATRPAPLLTVDGIEIDLARQLLFVVQGGQVVWAINTSTGKASTPTPAGDFAVDRQVDGVRHAPLGDLYRPKYFHGGIAVHGSPSIPGHAASHGCARVSNAAMDLLWASGAIPLGTSVRVH